MIDAHGYGQETGPIKVLDADPDKNIIFSFHFYTSLGLNDKTLFKGFDGLKYTGVCLVIGEFG
jgi:mannan endo-1,4-beta-mannosidase